MSGRGRSRAAGPEGIGDILKRTLGAGAKRELGASARARRRWADVAGEEIGARTSVVSFRRGVLRVRVESSPLLAELDGIYKKELIAALAEGGEPLAVRTIEFELAGAAGYP